jgi:PKD repeat protein
VTLRPIIEITPGFAEDNQEITFDGSKTVSENEIEHYNWSFSDGTTKSGETVTHNFSNEGIYRVSLTVEDSKGIASRAIKQVYIGGILRERGGEFPGVEVGNTVITSCFGDECENVEGQGTDGVTSNRVKLDGSLITQEILIQGDSLCVTSRVSSSSDQGCNVKPVRPARTVSTDNNEIYGWLQAPTIRLQAGKLCIGNCQTN